MSFKIEFEGQPTDSMKYLKKLINPSSQLVTRYRVVSETGLSKRLLALHNRPVVAPNLAFKVRAKPRYEQANRYESHLFAQKVQHPRTTAWRINSYGGDKTDLYSDTEIGFFAMNANYVSQHDPRVGSGFTYEPFGVENAGEVNDIAMTKLYSALKRQQDYGFDAALTFAELGQTLDLFISTAARINRSFRALRRGDLAGAYADLGITYRNRVLKTPRSSRERGNSRFSDSQLRESSNRLLREQQTARWRDDHLAWTYGVLPLLDDIDKASRKLASLVASRPEVFRVRGRHSMIHNPDGTTIEPGTPGMIRSVHQTLESEVRVQHVLRYTVSDSTVALATSLGFTNPMSLAWQVLPASFVFDWMFDVGGWLKNLTATFGLAFHSGCTSRSGSVTQTVEFGSLELSTLSIYNPPNGAPPVSYLGFFQSWSRSSIVRRSGGFRREVWDSFPAAPTPRVRLPSIKDKDGNSTAWSKLTSSLEMLSQRSGKASQPHPNVLPDITTPRTALPRGSVFIWAPPSKRGRN